MSDPPPSRTAVGAAVAAGESDAPPRADRAAVSGPVLARGTVAWVRAVLRAWRQTSTFEKSPAGLVQCLQSVGIPASERRLHAAARERTVIVALLGQNSQSTMGWATIDPDHLHVFTSPDGRMAHPDELRRTPDWVAAERCDRSDERPDGLDEWMYWAGGPRAINFQIGDVCNMHCLMCWQELRRSREPREQWHPEMSAATVANVLTSHQDDVDTVEFVSFGEPMANPEFDEIIQTVAALAARRGRPIGLNVITNGSLLRHRRHMAILAQPGHLTFSIDGADRAVYESIRVGGRWPDVIGNLRAAMQADRHPDRRVGINMTVFSRNVDSVFAMGALAAGLGVDYLSILHGSGLAWSHAAGMDISSQDPRLVDQIARIRDSFPWLTLNDYATGRTLPALPEQTPADRQFCPLPWRQFDVGPDGRAHPCCRSYTIDLGAPHEAWTGEPINELRRQLLAGEVDPDRFGACAKCPNVGPQRPVRQAARVIPLTPAPGGRADRHTPR